MTANTIKTAANKPAANKPAKAVAKKTTVNHAATVQQNLIAAITTRANQVAEEERINNTQYKGTPKSVKYVNEAKSLMGENAKIAIQKMLDMGATFDSIIKALESENQKIASADYLAIYALQKITKAVFAITANSSRDFDSYSPSILRNLVKLQKLDNDSMRACLNETLARDARAKGCAVTAYKSVAASTASTQASSTREMLRYLNICTVRKNAHNDVTVFADNAIADKVKTMFE